jgi:hypothetical protein
MNNAPPKYRTTIWRTGMSPSWYAWQVFRDWDRALVAGGECRQRKNAEKEAAARIRELQQELAA